MNLARHALPLLPLVGLVLALPAWSEPGDEAPPAEDAPEAPAEEAGEAPPADDGDSTEDTGSPEVEVSPTAVQVDVSPEVVIAPTPEPTTTPPERRNYVAVVVGISAYQHLPDAVELDFGRSDAATVAKALRDEARFDEVFLLGDGEASKQAISELMRTEVAQLVSTDDVLVFYYVGHGIGADLGLPVLLAADSTLENGQEDGFEITQLARDIQTWTRAGTTLIVTDVVHRNQLDGVFFYGPAADDWPSLPVNWMVLSASQSQSAGRDGAFGEAFAEAIAGGADADRDKFVTASELFGYLVSRLSPTGQIPLATGEYDGGMVIAEGVRRAPPEPEPDPEPDPEPASDPEPRPEPEVVVETVTVWPDYRVPKAKFVWLDGSGQTVQCREHEMQPCAGNCYVYDFLAGPCDLKAIYDGVEMKGSVPVLGPGKYDCKRKGGELVCSGP